MPPVSDAALEKLKLVVNDLPVRESVVFFQENLILEVDE